MAKIVFIEIYSPCNRLLRPREDIEVYFVLSFFQFGPRRGWVVNAMPWLLYLQESDWVLNVQEMGWVLRSVWKGVENLAPTEVRSLNHPASSESEYQLPAVALC
jgi:hypothetical protein